ncbi:MULTISPECIES: transglutaminase domain-containing protein [Flavobacterium]|uniref:Transglutaminase domain-containing protein n=1 Tax=Flavobacterium jumunjinense TaxID=998845 RepID=A0ABV5GP89_9FLAO|nr:MULTISPECIES: transglutaminase domain-containing protein [Flavobacterium]
MIKFFYLIVIFFGSTSLQAQLSDFKSFNFTKADAKALQYKGESLENMPKLAYDLTYNLATDVEKFRAIFIWVSTNIKYEYGFYLKNARVRKKFKNDSIKLAEWNKEFSLKVFKKLLKEQKTVCTGYAYLIKELSNLANIKCEIIDGYGRTANDETLRLIVPNHSWNAVQLNNKWYLCDATWSSGYYNANEYKFQYDFNDGYFLTDPNWFVKNHFPLDSKWLLTAKETQFSAFEKMPIMYNEAFKYKVFPMHSLKLRNEVVKNKEVVFFIKALYSLEKKAIKIEIGSGKNSSLVQPIINELSDGVFEIKHTFTTRGVYDVHFKMNEDYIFTYIVKVKK